MVELTQQQRIGQKLAVKCSEVIGAAARARDHLKLYEFAAAAVEMEWTQKMAEDAQALVYEYIQAGKPDPS